MNFSDVFLAPISSLLNPEKRLFFGYLLMALGLAVGVLWVTSKKSSVISQIFLKKLWFHPSAQLDYSLFFFNSILKGILFGGATMSSVGVSLGVVHLLRDSFPQFVPWSISYSTGMALFTLVSFVALDFSRFFQHVLFHKIPFLWRFHLVHHSATVLTPLTLYRTHPIESIIGFLRRSSVVGITSGLCIFSTGSLLGGYEIVGVNILDFVFNFLGSNLRHSHIWLSFGWLNYLFVSPAQHQIHHSRDQKHFDKNFGVALSIWDQILGSFYNVTSKKKFLIFGVRGLRHHRLVDLVSKKQRAK